MQSSNSARTPSESVTGAYHDILVKCNAIVEAYHKGEISKPAAYVEIQFKLVQALRDDRARTDAVFRSFIAMIESHDTEVGAAVKNGRAIVPSQRSPSPLISDSDGNQSDEELVSKRTKVDESAYAWVSSRKNKRTVLRDTLAKTLQLIEVYTINPKATKRSLSMNWTAQSFQTQNGKTSFPVEQSILMQSSVDTHDDPKVEKVGDLEITFGAVELMKLVKNGGDWMIAWNRTVRATVFAFPHRLHELSIYGEYIVNLFSVTHSSVHNRVIAFDKAVWKRVGSVRNLELSDFEKYADLKIAHMDSIGVSVVSLKDESG